MKMRSRLLILLLTVLLPWSAVAGALAPQCLRMQAQAATQALPDLESAAMDEHCPHAMAMAAASAEAAADPAPDGSPANMGHAGCACPHACTAANSLPSAALPSIVIHSERETLPLAPAATPRAAIVGRLLRPPTAA